MKLSSFYGKSVISTAGKEGYVISVYAGENKISCLICADENEKEFTIDVNNIKCVRDKIVFYDVKKVLKSGKPLRLGKPAFDCSGTYIGKVNDFTVDNFALKYAHVGNKKFSANDIVCGDAVIIKNSARILKSDVKSGGKVLIKRGTPLTPELLQKAKKKGEYVQTNLKTI